MKLPRQLQRFPDPTLLIATDEEVARFWLAGGDALEELDGIAVASELESDAEGAFTSYDGSRVAGPSADRHDTPRKDKFAKAVADRVASLLRAGHAAGVRLVAPPEMLSRILRRLPPDARQKILSKTPKNLMKKKEVEIVKALLAG